MPHSPIQSTRTDQELTAQEALERARQRRQGEDPETRADTIAEAAGTAAAQDASRALANARTRRATEDPEDSDLFAKVGGVFKPIQDLAQLAFPSQPITEEFFGTDEEFAEQQARTAEAGTGRLLEIPLRVTRGATLLPAGIERGLEMGIEEGLGLNVEAIDVGAFEITPKPVTALRNATEVTQGYVQDAFNNDPNAFLNVASEIAGAFATGEAVFAMSGLRSLSTKSAWRLLGPGASTPVTSETAATARAVKDAPWERIVALASEGALTTAGVPNTDTGDIIIGTGAGAFLGGGAELARKGLQTARRIKMLKKADEIFVERMERIRKIQNGESASQIENFPTFLARQDVNLEQTALSGRTGDQVISSVRATLSERGDTGARGVVRGLTEMEPERMDELRQAFPRYRFEVTRGGDDLNDQKLLYGLDPDAEVPEGTTNIPPKLTDDAVEQFERTGFMRGEKVLVQGQEMRVQQITDEGTALVKRKGRRPQRVPVEQLSRLNDTGGLLRNPRLLDEWQAFKVQQQIDDDERAFEEFWNRFLDDDEVDDALKPHLRDYLFQEDAKRAASAMDPDASQAIENFKQARRRVIRGESDESLEDLAAQKGFIVHRIDEARVELTNLRTYGKVGDGPFSSVDRAKEYIREASVRQPDITPDVEGVPKELLEGMPLPAAPPNPMRMPGDQLMNKGIRERLQDADPSALSNVFFRMGIHLKRLPDALRDLQRVTGEPVWDAARPLHVRAQQGYNRAKDFGDRYLNLMGDKSVEEQRLVEEWLRSGFKDEFAQANGMSDELVETAEQVRLYYEDLFREWSNRAGVDLSAEDWYANYAPKMRRFMQKSPADDDPRPATDLIGWAEDEFGEVPAEIKFMAEEMKSGAIAQGPQATLNEKTLRLTRNGFWKAFAGPEWENAFQTAKNVENRWARKKLVDYLAGHRGANHDVIQEELEKISIDIYKSMGVRNPESKVRDIINGAVDASYGGLIGGQVDLVARQIFQMPAMLGPVLDSESLVVSSQVRALRDDALRKWAKDIGARQLRIPLTLGENLEETGAAGTIKSALKKAHRAGLKPYQVFDDWNRMTAAIATRRKVDPLIKRFRAGELNETELLEESGVGFLDRETQTTFLNILDGQDVLGTTGETAEEMARNFAAREMAEFTNFLYGGKNSQKWIRGTLGRMFASYSTWPSGYMNYVDRLANANVSRGRKIKAFAKHGGMNAGLKVVSEATGVDLSNWVMWGSLFFGGGPVWDLATNVKDLYAGPDFKRAQAANELTTQLPRTLMPGGQLAFDNVPTAIERLNDSREADAFLELMGFMTEREEGGGASF